MRKRGMTLIQLLLLAVWMNVAVSKLGESNSDRTIASKYSSKNDDRILNVHIVPHSHDDVGWLKTVDQYYYGWNETIQVASVQTILDSVIEALLENQQRTFVYVETKFFSMWWKNQSDATKNNARHLIHDTKQLSFANGGWCMHDEATSHFMGMIDQMSLGHDFLKRELNVVPTVGWQLDPFGHSLIQATLMTHKMGFDALYFGRIDYQDRQIRRDQRECEGLWSANSTDNAIFWGLTGSYNGQYGPPDGMCFDPNCDAYTPLIEMDTTAVMDLVKQFVLDVKRQSDQTKGNHILITMGEDFRYQRASVNFANLDVLINAISRIQQDGSMDVSEMLAPDYDSINIFYSSPAYYTECKYNQTVRSRKKQKMKDAVLLSSRTLLKHQLESNSTPSIEWSMKHDDFFPYSDCPHCFWTGYYTSRPTLKRFERLGSSFLMAIRQLEALRRNKRGTNPRSISNDDNDFYFCGPKRMHELEDAMGILQHHDGVSGTSKQHVAYDYAKRLQSGIDTVLPCTLRKLRNAFEIPDNRLVDLKYCQFLNETKCSVSVNATNSNNKDVDLYVIVYNSLASPRSPVVDLPVGSNGTYVVEAWEENKNNNCSKTMVQAQRSFFRTPISDGQEGRPWVLSFVASSLPPIGAKIFRIRKEFVPGEEYNNKKETGSRFRKVSNGRFSLIVDTHTGDIRRTGSKDENALSTWGYYTSFDSKNHGNEGSSQNSGAYIFRPSRQELTQIPTKNATVIETSLGTEIHTQFKEPWIQTITKLRAGIPYIEIEYQVGPIPIRDGIGKEVVTRYNTMVDNQGVFFTDSNGREFVRRKRNSRPTWNLTVYEPIAGNYYPVNSAIYVDEGQSSTNPAAFCVVTDRSQGGGSISDGTIELMVHRRTLADDNRGVNEPMNETDSGIDACPPFGNATRIGRGLVIRGKHRILVENNNNNNKRCNEPTCGGIGGARLARSLMDESYAEPLVFVGTDEEIPLPNTQFSGVTEAIPSNVMLITKKPQYDAPDTYLVRLGHQYGHGEDPDRSLPVDVDLSNLFPGERIVDFAESTLSGNRAIEDWRNERFDWTGDHSSNVTRKERNTIITLKAMDIRTFLVKLAD